jgi:hypothetical protein
LVHAAFCLRHIRDRVCVPRDMSGPAARQLRAHLNSAADQLDGRLSAGAVTAKWRGMAIQTASRRDVDPAIFHGKH